MFLFSWRPMRPRRAVVLDRVPRAARVCVGLAFFLFPWPWMERSCFAQPAPIAVRAGVRINEILFDPAGADAGHEWIELFNAGPSAVPVGGWSIARGDGRVLASLPTGELPANGYLVVYLGPGENDADGSGRSGRLFTGADEELLDNAAGELAVYRGAPGAGTIVDFVAYAFDRPFVAGAAHEHAVAAGIWTRGAAFTEGAFVIEGASIGRDPLGTDRDLPADWFGDGGVQSHRSTPGAKNESPLGYLGGATLPPVRAMVRIFDRAADPAQAARAMLIDVIKQIRDRHRDLLGRNGDAGMGDAVPRVLDKADGKGGQKGDVVVGKVRFRFANSLTHDGKTAGGLAYRPDQPDGEVLIELSLSATDDVDSADKPIGNPVLWKLKEVVIHELAHAAHYHDLQSGYWRTEGGKTEPTSDSTQDKVRQVDEVLAYLTNLDLLRRLMDEFPPSARAGMEERYHEKIKIVIGNYMTTAGNTTSATDVVDGIQGDPAKRYGDHLREQLLDQARNLLKHKIYAFLIQNKGGNLTKAQSDELAREMNAFNDLMPEGRSPITVDEVRRIIEQEKGRVCQEASAGSR